MGNANPLVWSDAQQFAIIGHALRHPQLWEVLDNYNVTKEWLLSEALGNIFEQVVAFRERNKRPPRNAEELLGYIHESPAQIDWLRREATKAISAADNFGWDLLATKLLEWAKSRVLVRFAHKIRDTANREDFAAAFELASDQKAELDALDRTGGNTDEFETTTQQLIKLHENLSGPAPDMAEYGISFLDDMTGSIGHNEMHVICAETGVGKTELSVAVGQHNARRKKKVAGFFLEAAPQEVEARIAYPKFSEWYYADHPSAPRGTVDFVKFRRRQLNGLYEPYKSRMVEYFQKDFATFKTYYRKSRDFTVKTLEAKVTEAASWADLISLDHIHYIDTPGKDENREMHDIIKKTRDLSVHLGNPMLVIAHIRKHQGGAKEKRLLPSVDAIHGSSAIGKMATAVISIGRYNDFTSMSEKTQGEPTLIQAGKFRDDGSRTKYTALMFFDKETRRYREEYALGRLTEGGTLWEPLAIEDIPYWAKKHATLNELPEMKE